METRKYKIKGKKGIDDLKQIYAFSFNDGGGGSYSNDIEWYKNSEGWVQFVFDSSINPLDQEAINAESQKRIQWNSDYIKQLIKEDRFGEEYETIIEMAYNPIFDEPDFFDKDSPSTSSYRMVFLDFNNL